MDSSPSLLKDNGWLGSTAFEGLIFYFNSFSYSKTNPITDEEVGEKLFNGRRVTFQQQ